MKSRLLRRTAPGLLALFLLAACQTEIYSNVSEREANEMLAALLSRNVNAQKIAAGDGLFSLSVDEGDLQGALAILDAQGLPRSQRDSVGEVFAGGGIVSSPFEERVRYIYALGEDVAQTLQEIDGVLVARVHIVMPEEAALGQQAKPASAAVFIKQRSGYDLDFLVPQIRRLVANSIEGVSYEAITVVLVEAAADSTSFAALTAERPTVQSMGLELAPQSAKRLRIGAAVAAVVLLAAVAAAAALGVMYMRLRRSAADGPDEDA